MTAEVLRKAARLMRERAEGAPKQTKTSGKTVGVWLNSAYHMTTTAAVALAVAEWLTSHAEVHDEGDEVCDWTDRFVAGGECAALAVTRTYLNTTDLGG